MLVEQPQSLDGHCNAPNGPPPIFRLLVGLVQWTTKTLFSGLVQLIVQRSFFDSFLVVVCKICEGAFSGKNYDFPCSPSSNPLIH